VTYLYLFTYLHTARAPAAADGVDVKLNKYIEKKKQESSECQESIVQARQAGGAACRHTTAPVSQNTLTVQARQAGEKLEEDIRLAKREKDLTLAKKQKEVDELSARVSNVVITQQTRRTQRNKRNVYYATPATKE